MQISRLWLQTFFDAQLPDAHALSDALTFHAFEIDGIEKKGEDDVLDVKVTPNRGHDCLSHRGIAKELSAILKLPLKESALVSSFDISKKTDAVTVSIEDPALCKRYIAAYIKGVKIGPSPQWLQDLLVSVGQRPINNVVDATNAKMFNIGQPLHAFDANRLGSLNIGVRAARAGEKLEALDKKIYELDPKMLVITAADRPVGIAGIKGGEADRIDENTVDVVIESATFDGVAIRKGSQMLKLRTDASARFEQQLSPYLAELGMRAVVELIQEIAGGELVGFVDVYPEPQRPMFVPLTIEHVNKVLGTKLTGAEVADALSRLGFAYKEEQGVFEVHVPAERLDITIPEDLIEEVARIIGFERIVGVPLPAWNGPVDINQNFAAAEAKREELVAQGYSEVYTSVFSDKGERVVLNKVDGVKPYMRNSLVPGLTDALERNARIKDILGLKEVRLFEIGTIWKDGKEVTMLGMASEKGGVKEEPLMPGSASTYGELPLSTAQRYASFSKYPYIVRDIAMWTPAGTSEEDVRVLIQSEAGALAVRVELFDRFEKGDKVSLAFRIVFQSFERTLTEEEANAAMERVYAAVKAKGFEIR